LPGAGRTAVVARLAAIAETLFRLCCAARIDGKHSPCDALGLRPEQKLDRVGDVVHFREAAQGAPADPLFTALALQALRQLRVRDSRSACVYVHADPADFARQ